MYRGRELLGLPVVARDSGQELGRVKDLLFDSRAGCVIALVLEPSGWMKAGKALPLKMVESVGPDAILVAEATELIPPGDVSIEPYTQPCERLENLRGQRVFTEDRRELGRVEDLILEEDGWLISGLEVSGGFVQDLLEGREVVDSRYVLNYGGGSLTVNLNNQAL